MPKIYKFHKGVSRKMGPKLSSAVQLVEIPKPPDEVKTLIQGIMPDSIEEWRSAVAIASIGFDFEFQYTVNGGYFPGGQVIDFWIYTEPLPTPAWVDGGHWHGRPTEAQDEFKRNMVQLIYSGRVMPNVVVKAEDLTSVPVAKTIWRKELMG